MRLGLFQCAIGSVALVLCLYFWVQLLKLCKEKLAKGLSRNNKIIKEKIKR